ncbi:hypothetical protein [Clostridium butyricum]|uniref:hypothetical protein n=2 Tax=Clostridium TaxID=1485 RepID=UPI001AA1D2E9|nr:hypothetical protein [Clostridium butyricum]MBO1685400.1 hypothetical protein [Clostridium butyricum]
MEIMEHSAGYNRTSFTQTVYAIVNNRVLNYGIEDIKKAKKYILEDIVENNRDIYRQGKLKNKYNLRINDLNNLAENEFIDIIKDIKKRYIREEAILQLINENKLIPIDNIRPGGIYNNSLDILVDINYSRGNKPIYFFLDLLSITNFRVSRTVF